MAQVNITIYRSKTKVKRDPLYNEATDKFVKAK